MKRTERSSYLTITLVDGRIIQIERSQILNFENVDNLIDNVKREYVDLGLSVNWATCNVGADEPEEFGDYYAWGETEIKSFYRETNHSLHKEINNTAILFSSNNNNHINSITRYLNNNDVAQIKWGGKWRVPSVVELRELKDNCNWCWTTQNNIKGYKIFSNKEGYKDRSIFIPASGCRYQANLYSAGDSGYLWSNTLYKEKTDFAFYLSFYEDVVEIYKSVLYNGMSIRPVCSKE